MKMQFNLLEPKDIEGIVQLRDGEKKIGQFIRLCTEDLTNSIKEFDGSFVLFGVAEDIGPKANCGRGGANTAWSPFLEKFVNLQSNTFLKGEEILLLGHFDFQNIQEKGASLESLRSAVELIDEQVSSLVELLVKHDKIPIIIGGGHNNAYAALKGCSEALQKKVNCINCDPHADFRPLEGRHSGNGFSYAMTNEYLHKYSIVGLHENYNSQSMLQKLDEADVNYSLFEDIFVRNTLTFNEAIEDALASIKHDSFGIELDMDSIQHFPSSAQSPSGISTSDARRYVHICGKEANVQYLHLPEAAPSLVDGSAPQVGKMLAYLVSDFIKSQLEAKK